MILERDFTISGVGLALHIGDALTFNVSIILREVYCLCAVEPR